MVRSECVSVPGLADVLCWAFRTDNSGPPEDIDEVFSNFQVAQVRFLYWLAAVYWRTESARSVTDMPSDRFRTLMAHSPCLPPPHFLHHSPSLSSHSLRRVPAPCYLFFQTQFPGAKVIASTFDAFVARLATVKDSLPVVTAEFGDVWLQVGSYLMRPYVLQCVSVILQPKKFHWISNPANMARLRFLVFAHVGHSVGSAQNGSVPCDPACAG